jgi:voltage-gated potassium channel Kch
MLPLLTILLVTAISIFKLDLASATDSTCVILLKVLWVRLLLFMPLFLDTSCVFGLSSARLLVAQQWLLASIVVILSNIGSDWPTDLYDHLLNFSKAGFSNPAIQTLSCDWSIKCVGDLLLKLLEGVES